MKRTRKSLLDDIKTLQANRKTLKEFAKEKYIDENGVANIHIYTKAETIYNPLTDPERPELADEIIDFIDSESYYIPTEYPIKVVLHSEDDLDESYIESKLKEHYWKKLADKDDDLKNNRIISLVLFFIGVVLLSAYFLLESLPQTKDLFNELFSIAASFSVWESVDYSLLNRNALKIEYLNIAQLALIQVIISDNERNES